MTFDNVPEDHIYYFTTFQAQNPGRFLSCLRKEMALLMHSLPAGIIVRGYENRVVVFSLSFHPQLQSKSHLFNEGETLDRGEFRVQ